MTDPTEMQARIDALAQHRNKLMFVIHEARDAMENGMDADAFAILSAAQDPVDMEARINGPALAVKFAEARVAAAQARIEALEAENNMLRGTLEMVHADCIARAKKLPDGDFKVPVGASVWIAVCAALKGEEKC